MKSVEKWVLHRIRKTNLTFKAIFLHILQPKTLMTPATRSGYLVLAVTTDFTVWDLPWSTTCRYWSIHRTSIFIQHPDVFWVYLSFLFLDIILLCISDCLWIHNPPGSPSCYYIYIFFYHTGCLSQNNLAIAFMFTSTDFCEIFFLKHFFTYHLCLIQL